MRKTLQASIILVAVVIVTSISLYLYFAIRTEAATAPFTMKVTPDGLKGDAIAGQTIVFLVTVANDESGQDSRAVEITATAENSSVSVEPQTILPGQIAEVNIIPTIRSVGNNVTVTVIAERGNVKHTKNVNFTVVPGNDLLGEYAAELRDRFIPWLAAYFPDLGITNETQWLGTIVSPRWLVVSHYLFYSNDWEIHVYWHIMIPPYDWVRIDLRHRFTEDTPSLTFEIPSLNATAPPSPITPPETIWR